MGLQDFFKRLSFYIFGLHTPPVHGFGRIASPPRNGAVTGGRLGDAPDSARTKGPLTGKRTGSSHAEALLRKGWSSLSRDAQKALKSVG